MALTTNHLPDNYNFHQENRNLFDTKRHVLCISSSATEVNQARTWLSDLLDTFKAGEEIKYQLETVICEVINNIILHSYSNNKNNQIDIYLRVIGKKLMINIDDYGLSLNELNGSDMDLQSESGRGLFIIQSWSDKFRYWTFPSFNRHSIFKRIN